MNISKKVTIASLAFILMSVVITIGAGAQYYGDNPFDSAGAEAAFLGLSTMCCFVIALPFILGLVLGIWVYKDAEKRGKSGVLWLLIVWFVAFPIGLIIWFVVRPPIGGEPKQAASSERRCPNCGRIIPDDARVCPYCSKKFEE